MQNEKKNKTNALFVFLSALFVTNALLAEFIGVKIFSLEKTLGFAAANISLFGQDGLNFNLTAGVLIWPVVFVLTDIINEYFGKKGVMKLSYLAITMIGYAFIIIYLAIHLVPAEFWIKSHLNFQSDENTKQVLAAEVANYNTAFSLVFGQGLKIIFASLVAFFVGQILDALLFRRIKRITGDNKIWLRATGSTLVSQFFDSYIVLFIAFYFGANWPLQTVLAIGTINYIYKFGMAIILTPLIYFIHWIIEKFLGEKLSAELRHNALNT